MLCRSGKYARPSSYKRGTTPLTRSLYIDQTMMQASSSRRTNLSRQSRGAIRRCAIREAVRTMIADVPVADLSVSAITQHVGITRSSFYFYFDSKYAVLAEMISEAFDEITERATQFVRCRNESTVASIERTLSDVALIYQRHRPLLSACMAARNIDPSLDAAVRHKLDAVATRIASAVAPEMPSADGCADSRDVHALTQILTATTALIIADDALFSHPDAIPSRRWRPLAQLWTAILP